jgi:hypothetical protein
LRIFQEIRHPDAELIRAKLGADGAVIAVLAELRVPSATS